MSVCLNVIIVIELHFVLINLNFNLFFEHFSTNKIKQIGDLQGEQKKKKTTTTSSNKKRKKKKVLNSGLCIILKIILECILSGA